MNRIILRWLIALALFLMTTGAIAQTITQEAFLEQLKQNYPIFKKEVLSAEILRSEQNSLLGAQDWNIYSTFSIFRENPDIALADPERTDAVFLEGGVNKTFWKTGGRLSAGVSTGLAKIKIDPAIASVYGIPESFSRNKIEVTYIHPLLKNSKGFLDQLEYKLKKFDVDFTEVQALENQEVFLAEAMTKYLNWVLLTEQVKIIDERVKLNSGELERTQRKRAANLVDEVDVLRAEDAVRIAEQNRMLVATQQKALKAELAVLTGSEVFYNADPEFELFDFKALPSLEECQTAFKKNSRILKVLQIKMAQLDLVRSGYEETKKPELNFFTQLNSKSLDDQVADALKMDKYDITVGLQLQFPLEKTTAKSQIEKTDFQIDYFKMQQEEVVVTLTSALTNLHIQLEEMNGLLKLNQEQIESARKKTAEELKLYNQGRGSLTFVIQSQDSEERAKLLYAQNAMTYHQLYVQYLALMDEIL